MNKFFTILFLLLVNTAQAQGTRGEDHSKITCTNGNDTFSAAVDLRASDNPQLWGLTLTDKNGHWSDGYPFLNKLIDESDRCKNISGFNDNPKTTFLCAGELFMLTNIYGQVQISSGAEDVLSEVLLKSAGWTCEKE